MKVSLPSSSLKHLHTFHPQHPLQKDAPSSLGSLLFTVEQKGLQHMKVVYTRDHRDLAPSTGSFKKKLEYSLV